MPSIISRGAGSARAFGMGGGIQAGGATITFVNSATATGGDITIPASAAVGDIAILFDTATSFSATPSDVAPSGWTLIGTSLAVSGSILGLRSSVRYRVLTTGQPGSTVTGIAGDTMLKHMLVFRKSAGTWQTPAGNSQQATTGNPTLQTVTVGSAPLIVLGDYSATGDIDTGMTFSPTEAGELNAGDGHHTKYKIYNTGPQNTSVDMNDEGEQVLRSFYVSVA